MLIDQNANTVIITQETKSIVAFVKQIEDKHADFKNNHIIVNINSFVTPSLDELIEFLRLSNTHRTKKKSFVIVSNKVKIDDMPDELIVVPTLQEAYDIIEMEDIERDLEF